MDDDLFDGRGSRGQGCTGTEAHSEASGYDREQFEQLQQENDHLKSLNIKSTEKLTRLEEVKNGNLPLHGYSVSSFGFQFFHSFWHSQESGV